MRYTGIIEVALQLIVSGRCDERGDGTCPGNSTFEYGLARNDRPALTPPSNPSVLGCPLALHLISLISVQAASAAMLLSRSLSPIFCALISFAWAAPVAEADPELKALTMEDFKSSTAKGMWYVLCLVDLVTHQLADYGVAYRLVEHFSPYCPHCRSFEPSWRKLTEEFKSAEVESNFFMAQVNCITQGGACAFICSLPYIYPPPNLQTYVSKTRSSTTLR